MNTIITIVVVLSMVGLLFMMVNYARFIHSHKGEIPPENKDAGNIPRPKPDDPEDKQS